MSYTDSLNINGSYFQSKNKISNFNIEKGNNNNTNEDDDEEIILKPPCNDNIINMKWLFLTKIFHFQYGIKFR